MFKMMTFACFIISIDTFKDKYTRTAQNCYKTFNLKQSNDIL